MASEIRFTGVLTVFKNSEMIASLSRAVIDLVINMTGNYVVYGVITLPTTATAIPLGQVTIPGWAYFRNNDSTNKINLRNGLTGSSLPAMLPGEPAFFRIDSVAVPYGYGNIASCDMEYLICGN